MLAPSVIAGVVSALLYTFVFTFGLGLLFLFLPTLPIFWLGLSGRSDPALHAVLVATILISLFFNPVGALFVYALGLGLPAWYIARESMRHGRNGSLTIWFPMTVIFARLMVVIAFALLAVTLYYADGKGGLAGAITPYIHAALAHFSAEIDDEASAMLKAAAPKITFLVFSVSAWMWALCLYLHSWVVNRELQRQKITTRSETVIAAFPPPNWMISLLLIAAIASLIGGESLAFWGKSSLMILLFPHFLFGLMLLHAQTRRNEYRFLLLFFMYFLLAALLWPVVIVAGYGLIYHIGLLNKYLSAGGNSSRS
ncbi:MAG: DUF2232 domain-containing protein [Alphaproteobacteria bacterium]|nr:DUF2232 domain-containing protein [Alphaproteobacteria bacterium]